MLAVRDNRSGHFSSPLIPQYTMAAQEVNGHKLTLELVTKGAARSGVLKVKHDKQLDTPALLLYSKKGTPPNFTPDLLEKEKEAKAVLVDLQDL